MVHLRPAPKRTYAGGAVVVGNEINTEGIGLGHGDLQDIGAGSGARLQLGPNSLN